MTTKRLQADQSNALLYHARAATPFFSQGGEPCASIPSSVDSRRIVPLRSADFRDWLTANYFSEYETAPSALALRTVLRTLEARAQYGNWPAQKVNHRIGLEGDPFAPSKILLDMANPAGEILEITSQGWTITDNLRHSFHRSPGMLPLPYPANPQRPIPQPLSELAALLHLSPVAQIRVFFWLMAALRATGPYPILVLRGPASSGKSTLARALRTLIDPSAAPLRRLPIRDRELLQLALHNWILSFDHVHRIPVKISEALCAICSGEAVETAQPDYRGSAFGEIARPIVFIAPLDEAQSPWTPLRSLSNRTLAVDLAPIAAPRPEAAIFSDLEALRGAVLAALAGAVSSALRNIRDMHVRNGAPGRPERFADCAAWAAAAAPALDLDSAAMAEAVSDPESIWIGADPLRDALYALLRGSASGPNATWSGDASTLQAELHAIAPLAVLPSTPKALGQALARVPGIVVARNNRTLTIQNITQRLRRTQSPTPNP